MGHKIKVNLYVENISFYYQTTFNMKKKVLSFKATLLRVVHQINID